MQTIQEISDEVTKLGKIVLEEFHSQSAINIEKDAEIKALRSLLEELAGRQGIRKTDFDQHYKNRVAWFHSDMLQKIEDEDPSTAANVDNRNEKSVSTLERFDPLFPQQ